MKKAVALMAVLAVLLVGCEEDPAACADVEQLRTTGNELDWNSARAQGEFAQDVEEMGGTYACPGYSQWVGDA